MIKKSMLMTTVLILGLIFSSCSGLKPAVTSPEELSANQDKLPELQQQIEQLQNEKKSLQSELDSLQSVWTADLTGDGKNETITAPPWPTPVSLFEQGGSLRVEAADGSILLDEKSGILSVVGIYNVGAKTPVLITLQWGGGSMGNYYGAYLYEPETDKLKRLQWDNYEVVIGSLEDNVCKPGSIVVENRGLTSNGEYQPFYQRWIYKAGQMESVEKWDAPLLNTEK